MNSVAAAVSNLTNTVPTAGLPALGTCSIKMSIGEESFALTIGGGTIHAEPVREAQHDWDFTYSVDEQTWEKFCSTPPPRGYTSAQAIVATLGGGCVAGDRTAWARYATVVDRTFEALRGLTCGPRPERNAAPKVPSESRSPIVGGYLQLTVDGGGSRVYYESAGEGQPVLCLHTAGADSRQFRYLLEDAELTSRFRFVAFDMPWHGRSDPPDDWTTTKYTLDTNTYAATILAFMDELGLDRPILVGCSMGGAIALLMASRHGARFKGVCALEGGLGNPGRFVPWTNHIEVDHFPVPDQLGGRTHRSVQPGRSSKPNTLGLCPVRSRGLSRGHLLLFDRLFEARGRPGASGVSPLGF